jgi:hypothetical protein
MKSTIARNILIFLLGFLAVGAIGGGIVLILSPTGKMIKMPVSIIDGSPFTSFLIPGIILFLMLGLAPAILTYALLKKPEWKFAGILNFFPDMHWAWTYCVFIAFGLIIWLQVQMVILQAVHFLHTFYMFYAIAILFVALLPANRTAYKK